MLQFFLLACFRRGAVRLLAPHDVPPPRPRGAVPCRRIRASSTRLRVSQSPSASRPFDRRAQHRRL